MNKYYEKKRKIYGTLTALVAGLLCLMILPLMADTYPIKQFYQIIAGDKAYGCYETAEEAARELKKVRKKLEEKQNGLVLTDIACSVEPVEKLVKTGSNESVQEELYKTLEKSMIDDLQEAYTIKVNEFTVTVASEGAVIDTLETVKNKYDVSDCYDVSLVSTGSAAYLMPELYGKEGVDTQGLQSMGFQQKVEVVQAYVEASEVTDTVSAAAALTKEWETPTIYTVEKGDCLSVIAEKYNMTTKELMAINQLTDSEWIYIGDELVVTVPRPELSVWYKIQASYEEEYREETQYIDNSSWYTGTEEVIQEGTTGKRHVVADICYTDGAEVDREILEESIIEASQPRIIERGTSTPPTYIKPLVGGSFSSPFGSRWGRMHKGVDWACSVGTTIKASSGGTVASAGWVNGYGYCITISHPDGKKTRYAHLSKILVSAGESVKQGEKIALSGNTGNSTGPHLHFEIFVNGVQVNPMKYLE